MSPPQYTTSETLPGYGRIGNTTLLRTTLQHG